jgi:hypothetical protein
MVFGAGAAMIYLLVSVRVMPETLVDSERPARGVSGETFRKIHFGRNMGHKKTGRLIAARSGLLYAIRVT